MQRLPYAPAPDPYPECPTCGVWVRAGILCRNCGAVLSVDYVQPDPEPTRDLSERRRAWPPAWLLWRRMTGLSGGRP